MASVRRSLAAAFAVSVAIGSLACVLTIGPLPDAAVARIDGAVGDASGPAGAGADASADAPAPVDAEAGTPCSLPHLFCADFDGPTLEATFDLYDPTDAGVLIALDRNESKSPPQSVRVLLDPIAPSTGSRQARVGKLLAHLKNTARVEFDVRVRQSAPESDGSVEVMVVNLIKGAATYELATVLSGTKLRTTEYVDDTHYQGHYANVHDVGKETWAHGVLQITLGTSPQIAFSVDGVSALPLTPLAFPFDATDVSLDVLTGLVFAAGPTTATIEYMVDDLVVDGS